MTSSSTRADGRRITVKLPAALLERLDEHVTPRRRSRFIAEAIEDRLAIAEQAAALEEAAGAWSDENHPDMLTDEDMDRWLETLRSSWARPQDPVHG